MKKGYALLEIIAILSAFAILMALSVQPMKTFLSEIPKADKQYQTWMKTMNMLSQIRNDIEHATTIRMDVSADEAGRILSLEGPAGAVNYRVRDEWVVREQLPPENAEEWKLPDCRIVLDVWPTESNPAGVVVKTWDQTQAPIGRRNFEQTYVFFRKTK